MVSKILNLKKVLNLKKYGVPKVNPISLYGMKNYARVYGYSYRAWKNIGFSPIIHSIGLSIYNSCTMNTELLKILDTSDISEKDRYEYLQIFSLLSSRKKQKFLENAPSVIAHISDMRQRLISEQQLLMGKTLSRIEEKLYIAKKKRLFSSSHSALSELKEICK